MNGFIKIKEYIFHIDSIAYICKQGEKDIKVQLRVNHIEPIVFWFNNKEERDTYFNIVVEKMFE